MADPAMAASTCTTAPWLWATAETSARGSKAVVAVVPEVATTAAGRRPPATSAVMRASRAATSISRPGRLTGTGRRLSAP